MKLVTSTLFLLASTVFILLTRSACSQNIEKRDFIPEDDSTYNRDDISPILINDGEPGFDSSDDENTAVKSDFENNGQPLEFIENNNNNNDGGEDPQEQQESGVSGSGSGETELKRETIADDDGDDSEQAPTIETESGSDESGSGSLPDDASPKEEIEEISGSGSGALPSIESEKLQITKNQPDTHYDGSVYKRNKIPEPPATTTSNKTKRQYISRPRFVIRDGYVYMKAPPMTQKTIVTTHIPRPPMVMPYNTFMHRYRNGMPAGMPFQGME